jgi:hypothetical protein
MPDIEICFTADSYIWKAVDSICKKLESEDHSSVSGVLEGYNAKFRFSVLNSGEDI